MQCPVCKLDNDKVVDSRTSQGGRVIRRRRECLACGKRFTTYERIESTVRLTVVKKDGSRVPYDRDKILLGLEKACYKLSVSQSALADIVEKVEEQILANFDREVPSKFIGEQSGRFLGQLDQVAYVRFASVYREFRDVGEFIDEAADVMDKQKKDIPGQQELFK